MGTPPIERQPRTCCTMHLMNPMVTLKNASCVFLNIKMPAVMQQLCQNPPEGCMSCHLWVGIAQLGIWHRAWQGVIRYKLARLLPDAVQGRRDTAWGSCVPTALQGRQLQLRIPSTTCKTRFGGNRQIHWETINMHGFWWPGHKHLGNNWTAVWMGALVDVWTSPCLSNILLHSGGANVNCCSCSSATLHQRARLWQPCSQQVDLMLLSYHCTEGCSSWCEVHISMNV